MVAFKKLKTLVLMQLKDKIDMSFLKSIKRTILKVVVSVLLFALITGVIYVLLMFSSRLHFFSLLSIIPTNLITFVFCIMFILSVVTSTFGLMKTMYFAKDNLVLVTMPVTATQIFFSKMIVFYIYEIKKSFSFLVPLFIAFGMVNNLTFVYYIWMLFCFFIVSLLVVVIGALLSTPTMAITLVLKRYRVLQLTLFSIVLIGVFLGIIEAISLIPNNINIVGSWGTIFWGIRDFLKSWEMAFVWLHNLVVMICGTRVGLIHILFTYKTFVTLVLLILTESALIAISYFIIKPLFFKMVSSPFEYKKNIVKVKMKNRVRSPIISSIKMEFLSNLRGPAFLYNTFAIFAILPIAVILLNKIYSAMNTRLLGQHMAIVFNVLIILIIVLSANYVFASIYSKDGNSIYIVKTSPQDYLKLLMPKLIFNSFVTIVSLVTTFVIYGAMTSMQTIQLLLFFFSVLFVYVGHAVWSAEFDIMNPQNRHYNTSGTTVNNPNETKSTIIGFVLAFVFAILVFLLFMESVELAWIKVFLIAFVFMLMRIFLYIARVKIYYKEIEVN